jgi:hypothetical protein
MNARKYEVLTRAFFLTAIVSSMLYGKLGSLNWIAMGIGLAAAAGAAATYFYNAYSSDKPREEAAPQISKEALVQVVLAEAHEMRVARDARMVAAEPKRGFQATLWRESLRSSVVEEGKRGRYYMVFAEYQKHLNEGVMRQERLRIRERRMFLDEVVELVNRLTPTCEVQVSLAERQLTIRPVRGLKGVNEPAELSTPVASLLNSETSRQVN